MSTVPKLTPAMRRQMKKAELARLTQLGEDIPDNLLPTPLTICSSPTKYPVKICTFNKLFWQTSTNVKFDLFRLNPQIYPSTLCLVPTDIDKGIELNRLYFDQMLFEILMVSKDGGLDSVVPSIKNLAPIRKRQTGTMSLQEERRKSLQESAIGTNHSSTKKSSNTLDKKGAAIRRFLEKKLLMKRPSKPSPLPSVKVAASTSSPSASMPKTDSGESGQADDKTKSAASADGESAASPIPTLKTSDSFLSSSPSKHAFSPGPSTPPVAAEALISIRGIATSAEPTPVANASVAQASSALVPARGRATSFNSFKNLHREMENNLSAVRRNSMVVEKSKKAMQMQILIMDQLSQMRVRSTPKANESMAKRRWKKACHRVIMDIAVERTRAHLLRFERNTIS